MIEVSQVQLKPVNLLSGMTEFLSPGSREILVNQINTIQTVFIESNEEDKLAANRRVGTARLVALQAKSPLIDGRPELQDLKRFATLINGLVEVGAIAHGCLLSPTLSSTLPQPNVDIGGKSATFSSRADYLVAMIFSELTEQEFDAALERETARAG